MRYFFLPSLVLTFFLLACSPTEKPAPTVTDAAQQKDSAAAQNASAPKADADTTAKLLKPSDLNETAPDSFVVKMATTKGDIRIEITRDWSPFGADRFYNLVRNGFFSDIALFRMVKGFVVQFGIHGKPILSEVWREATIQDDPVKMSNKRGTLTFATGGPNTRTTQLFINLADNERLDGMGFSPIGKIIEGMEILDALNFEYAESPHQGRIQSQGNAYLKQSFPRLDYIESITIE
ncbi:MAG: peptidylprolyl isomerase [Proteobacteria bacterium]|nr:peptidylprolyl isomerase [Pseudomonadota bacterium]